MLSLEKDQEGAVNEGSYHLTVGEHLVGRKECSIKIDGDQSVSRKHAFLNVLKEGPAKFQVFLKDVSKYGCFINDVKCQSFEAVELKHNDKITFGSQNSSYRLKYESLLVFASCLSQSNKRHMKAQLSKLGGAMVNEWKKGCSHLIMEALSFTVKVIYALVTCIPIVKPSFFDDLVMAVDTKKELPLAKNYMPPIKEELIDPKTVSFHPNEARRSIFFGKLFLFSDQKQWKRLEQAINLASGTSVLMETGDTSGLHEKMLVDEQTLVMSPDLTTGTSEKKEVWLGYVGDVLKSVNKRPIAETEVGLAILYMSLDEYCNSSMEHVPRITKRIVYKSISSMEEMSQRISQSQDHTTDKLPISAIFDPLVSTTIPQNTKKRPREVCDELSDPAMIPNTPVEIDVEVKRSKLTNVTHVSQTPDFKTSPSTSQSHFSMQSLPRDEKTLGRSENRPRDEKGLGRSENRSYQDVSHVSESEKLSSDENINVLKTPFRKDNTVNSSDVIHISDDEVEDIAVTRNDYSEDTKHHRLTFSSTNTKRDVERTAVEKQKRTGVKHSVETEDKKSTMLRDVFGADNVSLGEEEIKTTDVLRQQNDLQGSCVQEFDDIWTCTLKRPFDDSKKDEIIMDPDSEVRGKIKETTSPVISLNMKRCKISTDKSRVSDTERSFTETLNVKDPLMVSSEDELFGSSNTSKNVTINNDMSEDVKKSFHDNEYQLISEKKGEEASDKVNNDFTGDGSGTDDICLSKSPLDSGWMCKKSFCIKEEEKGPDDNIANTTNAVDTDSDIPIENCDDAVKVIKEEEYERDLISVEYTALVIVKVTHPEVDSLANTPNTSVLKNVKKFRKQNINGNRYGLPEIIGGSDLVVFSSRNIDTEEWILQVQEMNEEDAQDKDADNLFRYNPTTSKKRHRR